MNPSAGEQADLEELRQRLAEISDLGRARALAAWDERTMMPAAGGEARAEMLATLARVRHERATDPRLGELLAGLERDQHDPHEDDDALIRSARRDWEKATRVPAELRAEITRAASLGEQAWERARADGDFRSFAPFLERNIELAREQASLFAGWEGIERPYDALLDDYEPGMRTAELMTVLAQLRAGLTPLVERARERAPADEDAILRGSFGRDAQERFCRELAAALPLGEGGWRLDPTVHPFAVAIGHGDTRITTRYDDGGLGMALWSVLHEAGHAMYDGGVPPRLRRSPIGRPCSLGFHESQSRLWENQVGRSAPFCEWLAPRLREPLGIEVSGAELFAAANVIAPSLIRVEADEVTYNLHIALRFELEIELFEGGLEVADLPEAWRARTRSYLGLEIPGDAEGVLQDVHWAGGAFGYFPTYSLGNVIAAQLWEIAGAELGGLGEAIAAGEFEPLGDWLGRRVHSWAGKLLPGELVAETIGALDPGPLLRHLTAKVELWSG